MLPLKMASWTPNFTGIHSGVRTHIHPMETLAPVAGLRGDYTGMTPDWTVPQPEDYSAEDQAVWRLLVERQTALARQFACAEFVQGLETLGIGESIPDFELVNAKLEPLTGWRVVGVPGLIPDAV